MGNTASASPKTNYCRLPEAELLDPTIKIRVAVIGRSGAGKSSLVNALCDLEPTDRDAAATGVTECTAQVTSYAVGWCSHIKVYDTPGFGTPTVPWEAYKDGLCVDQYDAVIIVNTSRLIEQEVDLALKMQETGMRYFFVCTKVDEAIESDREDYPDTHQESEVLSQIAVNYISQLESAGVDNPEVHLISSRRGINRSQLNNLKVLLSNLQPLIAQ